jgi:hypothetical protein
LSTAKLEEALETYKCILLTLGRWREKMEHSLYTRFLAQTGAMTLGELLLSLALSTVVFWGVELERWLMRRETAAS